MAPLDSFIQIPCSWSKRTELNSSRRAKVVPFLQRLLTLNKVINNLPLSQGKSEDEVVQEVVKLADEMGLRIADFKDAIASPSSRQAALDQISEVKKIATFPSRNTGHR
jgi:hypothetical protein